ncbi:MAG: hypothetical protein AAF493_04210 [Pseudomonadota bacterium]
MSSRQRAMDFPKIPVQCAAELRAGADPHRIFIEGISPAGIDARCDAPTLRSLAATMAASLAEDGGHAEVFARLELPTRGGRSEVLSRCRVERLSREAEGGQVRLRFVSLVGAASRRGFNDFLSASLEPI